ncbi:YusW family protein [Bacillus coahuilensis]|uniref:YusW family protein n=1 Tax=Bacillus coahuilensis TaxID=408580 RepID=UPI000185087C|nr:YusW family protein [Bacillus coahuilensis]
MNKWITCTGLAILLVGCTSEPEEEATDINNNEIETNTVEKNDETEDTIKFDSFELSVDIDGLGQEYTAEYEKRQDGVYAYIDDNINDQEMTSSEAYKELAPLIEKLAFDENTPDELVVEEVVNAFNLRDDFESFELEIEFDTGSEKEYVMEG